jgi:hypothetical protein
MTPLFVVEDYGEWRLEVCDDGAVRFIDYYEGVIEIAFGVEL